MNQRASEEDLGTEEQQMALALINLAAEVLAKNISQCRVFKTAERDRLSFIVRNQLENHISFQSLFKTLNEIWSRPGLSVLF